MKRMLSVLLCLVGIVLAGCTVKTEEENEKLIRGEAPVYDNSLITIGLIQTGKESDWRDANTDNYLETFTQERGYNLIYIDGNSSPERQVKAMEDLIQQKVDYIVLQPIVEDGWEEAMGKAKAAGIPVIVADRQVGVNEQEYTTWIGSDFYAEGEKAILWLEEYLVEQDRAGEDLNIVILEGTEGATATIGRTESILAGIEQHDNWTIVAQECANFTQGEGQTVMEELLGGQIDGMELNVIISENDNMAFGAMKALEQNGYTFGPNGDIIIISFDALGEAFEKMINGELHVSVECNPLLASTVEQAIRRLEAGETLEKKYYAEEAVYTYENASQYIDERTY